MKDSYEIFIEKFAIDREALIQFGIEETIKIDEEKTAIEWENLKLRIVGSIAEPVFFRGAGRDAKTTALYLDLFNTIFPKGTFLKDSTNNAQPKKLLEQHTKYKRSKKKVKGYEQLLNYQVSHIFGRTKNPYAFTAPWNVVYLPKIMDPFTGHESSGEIRDKFSQEFKQYFLAQYAVQIAEFNQLMEELKQLIDSYLETVDFKFDAEEYTPNMLKKFKENVLKEFAIIDVT